MKKPSTFSIRNIAFALAAALSLAVLPTIQASLLVQDQFSYSAADVVGDNGGTGWLNAWYNPPSGGFAPWGGLAMGNRNADAPVVSPGLTYSTLSTADNSLSVGGKSAMRQWDFAGSGLTSANGNSLWVSFLVDPTSVLNKIFVLPFGNIVAATPNYQYGAGAILNYASGWTIGPQIRTGGTSSYAAPGTTISLNQNQTYLVVMQFIYNGGAGADVENMWVDPTLTGSSPDGTELTATGTLDLSGWLLIRGGSTATGFIDEINIGNTYSDVVPVPEPSTLALSLIGGVMGLVAFCRSKALNPRQ
jgi:hypothetical protein